jgi:hypothetical protein
MTKLTLPSGFVEQYTGNTLWWLKIGWESRLPALISRDLSRQPDQPLLPYSHSPVRLQGGRGGIRRVPINEQETIIVRRYYRGGFVRHFLRNLYWDRPLRPFAELHCTEEARRRGVPTVEVLGAQVEWVARAFYRGLLITREASGFQNLWAWLQTEPSVDLRQQTVKTVAQTIAIMHNAGIAHADLNLTNLLVGIREAIPQVLVIDFDRARLFPAPVPLRLRKSNLRRLHRSQEKLDPLKRFSCPTELALFCQFYRQFCPE